MRRIIPRITLALLFGLLVAAAGCAYRQAVKKGDEYAEKGKWQAAYSEYEEADEHRPDSEEVDRKLQQARRRVLEKKLGAAREAIEAKRWKRALEFLDGARYYSREEGFLEAGYEELSEAMLHHIDAAADSGDVGEAYRRADRMRDLLGESDALQQRTTRLRDHFFERAESHADGGDWERALDALATIDKWGRPDGSTTARLEREERRIRAAWADEVRSDARRHADEGHPGPALLRHLRAWEIVERPADRRAARNLASQLRGRELASLALRVNSRSDATAAQVHDALRRQLDGRRTLRVASDATGDSELEVVIEGARQSCEESVVDSEMHGKRYLESTYQVSNPEWERLSRRRDRVCDARGPQEDRVRRMHRHVEEHRREYRHIKHHKLAEARRRVEQLERKLRDCRYDSRRHDSRRHDRDRDDHRHHGNSGDCDSEARRLDRAEYDVRGARRRVRHAHREWHEAIDDHEDAVEELDELEERCEDLEDDLRRTPRMVTRENWATFRYRVDVHRRRCTAQVTYRLGRNGAESVRRTISAAHDTRDKAHPAHPAYDIAADRLDFPSSRRSLLGRGYDDLGKQLAAAVDSALGDYYRRRASEALDMLGPSPRTAVDRLVGLRLAGGEHLSGAQTSAIDSHLASTYGTAGLDNLD